MLLRQVGFEVSVTAERPTEDRLRRCDVVIISKSFTDDDMWLASRAEALGKALVVDLCDDIFGESRDAGNADAFRKQGAQADLVTTTGEALRDIVARQIGGTGKISIVPDHAETLALTRDLVAAFPPGPHHRTRVFGAGPLRKTWRRLTGRERALGAGRKTVVWFGMAGLPRQGAGIEALAGLAPHLNAVNNDIPLQLLIVSTAHGRVRQAAKAFAFPWVFRDWSLLGVYEHVARADACVIPNPPTAYAAAKSPNRALLALCAGTPVIASASPAYAVLGDTIVTDDWQGGLRRYLTDPQAVNNDLAGARGVIDREFAPAIVRDRWAQVFTDAVERRRRAPRPAPTSAPRPAP
jgi:hypothetical protein